jgi:hypothetical protein
MENQRKTNKKWKIEKKRKNRKNSLPLALLPADPCTPPLARNV